MSKRAHGEGSTPYRYRDGWAAKITLRDELDRPFRKTVYGATKQAVEAQRRELADRAGKGRPVARHSVTVGEYLTEWVTVTLLAEVALGRLTQRTADSYTDLTLRHLIPGLGHIPLTKLSTRHIRTFLTAKGQETSSRGKPHSERSIQYLHAILRRALGDALRDDEYGLERNVAALVKVGRPDGREGQPLASAEARQVLAVITGDRLGPLWLTYMTLGLRKVQALDLAWAGIDLDAGTAVIPPSKERAAKGRAKARTVILPPTLVEVLRQHRQAQRKEQMAATRWSDTGLVFTTPIGTRLDPRNINRMWASVLKQAGVEQHHTVHDLRHTAASLLLLGGEDLKVVSNLLGHTRLGTTADIYASVLEERERQSATLMDTILTGHLGYAPKRKRRPSV